MEMQRYTQSTGVFEWTPILDGAWRTITCLLMVLAPVSTVRADEASDMRQTLEKLGYEVVESVDSKEPVPADPNKERVLLKSPENVMLHVISTTTRITPSHARTPEVFDVICEVEYQWGTKDRTERSGRPIRTTYLILYDENSKLIVEKMGLFLAGIGRDRPARRRNSIGQTFPPSFRSGWGAFIVIGADSKRDPLRLLAYHRFRIPPVKREPRSGVVKQTKMPPSIEIADAIP